jgi:hypothetical protein
VIGWLVHTCFRAVLENHRYARAGDAGQSLEIVRKCQEVVFQLEDSISIKVKEATPYQVSPTSYFLLS